jgi:DNA polymerase
MGYEGGVGAFVAFALVYKVDLEALAEVAWPTLPSYHVEAAIRFHAYAVQNKRDYGLPPKVFVVCDTLKRMWREGHPATVELWKITMQAAVQAVQCPGQVTTAGYLSFFYDGFWLRMKLPSGRYLCYPQPQASYDPSGRPKLSYMGINQFTRQWSRIGTHGGKLGENSASAFSRDVFLYPSTDIEAAGYSIVLQVHDENVTETPDSAEFNNKTVCQLMTRGQPWAPGLPLDAKGADLYRYGKS